jgi:hypothetical protein
MRFLPISRVAALAAVLCLPLTLSAQEKVDVATIERIKTEAMDHSQVMDIMSWLTDVHGPRLTGSPITKAAGDWAIATLRGWGLSNVHYESWGPFGMGWTANAFSARVVSPHPFTMIGYAGAWSTGTAGAQTGRVTRVALDSAPDLEKVRGTLRGAWVIMADAPELEARFDPMAARLGEEQLARMAAIEPPSLEQQNASRGRTNFRRGGRVNFTAARNAFLVEEGALGVLQPGRGDGGTVFVSATGSRAADAPASVPTVVLAGEHYGKLARMVERGVPVEVEINSDVSFYGGDLNSFNIIGEIPGTDPALKDEVVMIGAHFDSWHAGTGATDNGAGTGVMMEAMRILKALDLAPRRTIKIGLWTGEEQGLLGSRAYVAEHFGTRDSTGFHPTAEQAKFAAYFNVDNGTGKIRGVYQQSNPAVAPIFEAWMAPFKTDGMATLTITNTGGTDHLAFDGAGLPGFQFIQDPVEYSTRTHHSNMDTWERLQADDMKWNSAVLASFAWQAAQRDEKLPRKALD